MNVLPDKTFLPYYAAMAACVLLTTAAQLLLKAGAARKGGVLGSFLNPHTLSGYALLGLVTVLSTFAMQKIDMKTGSTWAAVPYFLVVLLAWLLFHEKVTRKRVAGCALIVLGLLLFHLG
jgi:drug/metabolite transporter (DMT)-like permease